MPEEELEEEFEDESENAFDREVAVSRQELTKEQWRIAYWKLRNRYRQEQLSKQLNLNFKQGEVGGNEPSI